MYCSNSNSFKATESISQLRVVLRWLCISTTVSSHTFFKRSGRIAVIPQAPQLVIFFERVVEKGERSPFTVDDTGIAQTRADVNKLNKSLS